MSSIKLENEAYAFGSPLYKLYMGGGDEIYCKNSLNNKHICPSHPKINSIKLNFRQYFKMATVYILFLTLGVAIGVATAFLIVQLDASWKKGLVFSADAGILATFLILYKTFNLPPEIRVEAFIVFIISLLISTIISVYKFAQSLKKNSDPDLNFNLSDIILGHSDSLKQYYELKKQKIESKLNLPELQKKEEDITKKEKELEIKANRINQEKRKIEESINKALHIDLPINSKFPVDHRFLDNIPKFVDDYLEFSNVISESSLEFEKIYRDKKYNEKEILDGFLFNLCTYTSKFLFGSNKDVRVHVRYLKDGKYKKYISTIGENKYTQELTPISLKNSMIDAAGQNKRSLIKSLNESYHENAENDHLWEDYMTLVFDQFYENGAPYLSMGISVKNRSSYNDFFVFLNYCKFEQLIQEKLLKIDKLINIKRYLYK